MKLNMITGPVGKSMHHIKLNFTYTDEKKIQGILCDARELKSDFLLKGRRLEKFFLPSLETIQTS